MSYINGYEYRVGQRKCESIHHRMRVDLDGNKVLQEIMIVAEL